MFERTERHKSTVDEIRQTFDDEVETYANLETGQAATVDSPLAMSLVAEAAAMTTPHATSVLDVGCGAGNYTLKLLERIPSLHITLVDLSRPMLDRAVQRIQPLVTGPVDAIQSDIRHLDLGRQRFDILLASAVLHHLRTDDEWRTVFQKFHAALKPGGSLWIFDLVESRIPEVKDLLWRRYGEHLTSVHGEACRDEMFERIIREDTPRSVTFQLDLLREVGFSEVEILHKRFCYAAFGAVKR
ncbi:MAG: class I SAM-dependent methyltransferase [Planctomycetales bacterium]|nr:class I SAM-dependent methyltransferase [Planctomycetales bacterium]